MPKKLIRKADIPKVDIGDYVLVRGNWKNPSRVSYPFHSGPFGNVRLGLVIDRDIDADLILIEFADGFEKWYTPSSRIIPYENYG